NYQRHHTINSSSKRINCRWLLKQGGSAAWFECAWRTGAIDSAKNAPTGLARDRQAWAWVERPHLG
ncbi:hypothetical protein, partial [Acinetobacter baumannii]|uniref:hypothetical protein n=1 Tax=Acinetobacter baumannii TaxID=470 RepID=UPI002AFF291B